MAVKKPVEAVRLLKGTAKEVVALSCRGFVRSRGSDRVNAHHKQFQLLDYLVWSVALIGMVINRVRWFVLAFTVTLVCFFIA